MYIGLFTAQRRHFPAPRRAQFKLTNLTKSNEIENKYALHSYQNKVLLLAFSLQDQECRECSGLKWTMMGTDPTRANLVSMTTLSPLTEHAIEPEHLLSFE